MAILLLDRYSNASPLGFLPLVGVIGFFAYRSYRARKRSTALVEAVKQHSWEWLGKEVPIDVPMNGLVNPTGNDIYTRNVFGGKQNGRAFIAFDCTISSGRNGRRLNVVTVQAQDNPFRMADSAKITNTEGWFAAAQNGDIDASRTVALIESL